MNRPVAKTMRVPWIAWLLFAVALAGLLMLFSFIANLDKQTRQHGFEAPDDVKAARELLASKFSGPHYFQIGAQVEGVPYPYISVIDARTQTDRIIQERKLAPEAAAQINQLVEKLTVPASSRVVGIDHVNALQLNLALDKLR